MTTLVGFLLLFLFLAVFFVFIHLMIGKLIRPSKMDAEKATIYECGEPTIGSAWIQFDLRFYVIALLFVVFDVEVAFFFPWAVVFGQTSNVANAELHPEQRQAALASVTPEGAVTTPITDADVQVAQDPAKAFAWVAFFDILVFFGVLLVGFAYLWKRGDLVWVRSTAAEDTGVAGDRVAAEDLMRSTTQIPAGAAS